MRQAASKGLDSLPKREAVFIEPMECAPVTKRADGQQWVFEIKLDGYRAIAVKSSNEINLYSRRSKSFNSEYPDLVEALADLRMERLSMEKWLRLMLLADRKQPSAGGAPLNRKE